MWFAAPALRLTSVARDVRCAVFLLDPSPYRRESDKGILSCGSASFRVLPVLPCPRPQAGAPLVRFSPLQHRQMRQLLPRGSTLEYRPRLRFLTVLAGILPAHPFQAYFIPEALLGFSLQGFPLEQRPESSSPPGSPLVVPTVATASLVGVPRNSVTKAWVDFRGLLSVRVRSRYRGPLRLRHGRSPPGFSPP